MLDDLEKLVSCYYKWIKITEHTITEIYGNRRHGYRLEFNGNSISIQIFIQIFNHF